MALVDLVKVTPNLAKVLGLTLEDTLYGNSVADLRTLEPSGDAAVVTLNRQNSSIQSEESTFYYDPTDTTTPDDGIFTFVTSSGKRWKRSCDGSYISLAWFGVRPGQDAAPALNAIGSYLKARAISAGTVTGLPRVLVPAGYYTLSTSVRLHFGFKIFSRGNVEFAAVGWDSSITKDIFTIANDLDMPYVPDKGYTNRDAWIDGSNGSITITGPNYSSTITNNVVGVGVGNLVTGATPIRGNVLNCVSVKWCGVAVLLRMRRMYLTSFVQCHFELNWRHLSCPTQSNTEDSGERISFRECVFGGSRQQHLYIAMSPNIHFDACSFDFTQGTAMYFEGISEYGLFTFNNCHFENFNNWLVYADTGPRFKLFINHSNIFPNSQLTTAEAAANPSRPLIYVAQGATIELTGVALSYSYRPLGGDNFLVVAGSDTAADRTRVGAYGLTAGDRTLTACAYSKHVLNRSPKFSGEAVGASITNASTYTTQYYRPLDGATWSSGITCAVISAGSGKALQLTSTGTGAFCSIQVLEKVPVRPGKQYCAYFSMQKLLASGSLNWALNYRWYDAAGTLILEDTAMSGSMGTVYSDSTLPGYSSDATANGQRILSSTFNAKYAPPGAVSCIPYLSINNVSGVININSISMWEVN